MGTTVGHIWLFIQGMALCLGEVVLYGISTIVGYLMPITFLYIGTVLFQTIQFNLSAQFKMSKTVQFQTLHFS